MGFEYGPYRIRRKDRAVLDFSALSSFCFRTTSLALLRLIGLRRSLGLLCGLRLLVGEHLLLDEHAVGLRGVLLLGHAHAFLMTQLVGVGEHAGLDRSSKSRICRNLSISRQIRDFHILESLYFPSARFPFGVVFSLVQTRNEGRAMRVAEDEALR